MQDDSKIAEGSAFDALEALRVLPLPACAANIANGSLVLVNDDA